MVTFVDGPVRVSVPATSANLGPGFDSLGLALSLRDELEAEVAGSGLEVEVAGSGADDVARDESHLVVRAMRAAFAAMDAAPPGLRLSCTNVIPHARGLGSSSAAIVAGVCLARGLVAGGALLMDDDAVFRLAARLEGHPDNVAPALYGGFLISGRDDDSFWAVRSAVDPRVGAVVFVPPTPVSTELARDSSPARSRTGTRLRTPGVRRCSSQRSPASPSTCTAPRGTTCTRSTGGQRCRSRWRSSTRFGPTVWPPSSPGRGRPSSRSAAVPTPTRPSERPGSCWPGAPRDGVRTTCRWTARALDSPDSDGHGRKRAPGHI